jgi:hypothetical protein
MSPSAIVTVKSELLQCGCATELGDIVLESKLLFLVGKLGNDDMQQAPSIGLVVVGVVPLVHSCWLFLIHGPFRNYIVVVMVVHWWNL